MGKRHDFDKQITSEFYRWSKNNLLMTVCGIYHYEIGITETIGGGYTRYCISINKEPKFYYDVYQTKTEFYLCWFYLAVEEYINMFDLPNEWVDFSCYIFKKNFIIKFYTKQGTQKDVLLSLDNKFLKTKVNEFFLGKSR